MSVAPNPAADPTSIQLSDVAAPSAIVTSVTLSSPALRRGTDAVVVALLRRLPAYLPGAGTGFSCAGGYGAGSSLTPRTAQRPPRHSSVL